MRIPKYRLHKCTGLALVEWQGKRHYLGKFGSPESKAAYDQFLRKHGIEKIEIPPAPSDAALRDLLWRSLSAAEERYRGSRFQSFVEAAQIILDVFNSTQGDGGEQTAVATLPATAIRGLRDYMTPNGSAVEPDGSLATETLLSLEDARLEVPGRNGKPISYDTIRRWVDKGLRGRRLEAVKVGGIWKTSKGAITRFMARLNPEVAKSLTKHNEDLAIKLAQDNLRKKFGLRF